jgi:archaellum component FlaC
MISSNLASFKATVESKMALPLEQVTFLSGMITARGGLNGDKPTAHVLNSIDFYFNNFKGRANLEAALAEHTSYFNELNNTWWDLSSTKFRIKAAQDTWIGLDGTRNTIRDYFDGWMTDFDLGSRVGDLLNGDPLFKDAWLGLKDKYLDLPKISGHGKALMDVRDRTGNVKDRITALRDEIKAREDEFNTAASKVGTLRSAMSSYITTYGWASLFGGIYGAKAAEAYIFVDVMSKLDGVLDNIVDAFDKVSNTYAGMRLKIEDIATEVGNLQSTLKTRDIRN